VKREERGCARAAEQVFKTCELTASSAVVESESRFERTFSTFSGAKDSIHEQLLLTGKDGFRE